MATLLTSESRLADQTAALTATAASATAMKASASRRPSWPIPKIRRLRTRESTRTRPRLSRPGCGHGRPQACLAQAAGRAIPGIRHRRKPVGGYGLLATAAEPVRTGLDPIYGVLNQREIFMCPEHASHQPRIGGRRCRHGVGRRPRRQVIVIGDRQDDNLVNLLPPQLFETCAAATVVHQRI